MSEAFDPDSTPNSLADEPGQDAKVPGVPVAPHPHGEVFTDENGERREVPPPTNEDGSLTGESVRVNVPSPDEKDEEQS